MLRLSCLPVALSALSVIALISCSGPRTDSIQSKSIPDVLRSGSLNTQWLTYGHDYSNDRFSPLTQIDRSNVGRLIPAFVFQTGVIGPFETTPLVQGRSMYLTTPRDGVFAINATNGDVFWERPPLKGTFRLCCGPVNRGVALSDHLVIVGQVDGVLVALDRTTGKLQWASVVADNADGYSITMAPLVYRTSVLVGVAGGDLGIRGSLSSYSLSGGRLQWRWYATDPLHWFSTPRAVGSAHARRQFAGSWRRGGGAIWTTPAIDPIRNAIYVTTGNPWPDLDGTRRPGDNLFTDCIVALNASTGTMKWYFQETPHDTDDLDAASPPFLLTTNDKRGRKVAAVGEVGKTGVLYILNRDTGELIRRSEHLIMVGTGARARKWEFGAAWSPVAYDPRLGYAIVLGDQYLNGASIANSAGSSRAARGSRFGTVSAIDTATGKVKWQDEFDQGLVGGAVSTSGGLTFVGEGNGNFDALATDSGKRLWHFQTGAGVNAAPIAFESSGQEYIAVASGGNQQYGTPYGDALFVFRIGPL